MALTYALTTWPHLKAFLRSDAEDELLAEALIDAATKASEAEVDNAFVSREFTQRWAGGVNGYRGGAKRLFLERYPVNSITSIVDTADGTHTVPSTDYVLHPQQGVVEHVSCFPPPDLQGLWLVTYNAGRFATTDAVEEDLRLACHLQVQHWLRNPTNFVSSSAGDKSKTYRVMGSPELLPGVRAILRNYRSVRV